jgi:predicted nucleotide-binding protein
MSIFFCRPSALLTRLRQRDDLMTTKKKQSQNTLPKLFIGSSTEALPIVTLLTRAIADRAKCISWTEAPEFSDHGSRTTFAALCYAAQEYDFALFILSFDDVLLYRRRKYAAPRDNVLFEIGLFVRALGPERVLILLQDKTALPMKIPSDLAGVNMPRFKYLPKHPHASLESMQEHIGGFMKSIESRGFRQVRLLLASKWGYCHEKQHFEVLLGAGNLEILKLDIGNMRLAIAARTENRLVNFEDDNTVVYSAARAVPHPVTDMVFQIVAGQFPRTPAVGDWIQSRIILLPAGMRIAKNGMLKAAVGHGCKDVESCSAKVPEK